MKMHGMGVQAVLAVVLLLFTATVKAQGGVSFWKTDVTMTCPGSGKWFEKDEELKNPPTEGNDQKTSLVQNEYTFTYNGKATYRCEYQPDENAPDKKEYYFYVEGKVCEHCYEVDASLIALVIVMDLVGTALLMLIIFTFTKTKNSAGPAVSSRAPARSGGRAAGASEYESLNPQTRSQGTYAVVNRTG